MRKVPQTIVETPTYLKTAAPCFSEAERAEVAAYIGSNPEAGSIMPETGGVRKLRWGVSGRGKSRGVRVIYYVHNENMPVFLLTVYAKNAQANLTAAERNEMRKLTTQLSRYGDSE